jgi:hypothetical protein
MAHHHSVYASDLINEVVDLEAALALDLHLMRVSLCNACDHLGSGWEVVNQPGVLRVAHPWCSSDGTNKIEGQMNLCPSNPSEEGITDSPVDVGVELPYQLLYHRTVILHHLSPTLGLKHCPDAWSALVKV